jgi:hypothetical protein
MRRSVIVAILLFALSLCAFAASAEDKSPAYSFKFSGYFKGDFVYDQARVNSGNYALYALDKSENDVMSVTARESRFGLDFTWKENGVQTDARFEFDFYGPGASSSNSFSQENKPAPMLRHAYLQVTKGHWSILAGQTSDIISPLVPKTVNYTVCWDQGNIGYRRPQLKVSASGNASEKIRVSGAFGAFRTLGGDLDGDGIDDGADAAIPTFEGRIAMTAKLGGARTVDIGFSGHYGKEEYQVTGETHEVESWSRNADVKLTLCDCFEVSGELFTGKNLGSYFGGIGQSVNATQNGVLAKGGWVQASYKPHDKVWLHAGYAIDDPDEEVFVVPVGTVATKSFLDANANIFGSVMYSLTSTVTAMLEVSQLTTSYLYKAYFDNEITTDEADFDNLRVQFALKAAIK